MPWLLTWVQAIQSDIFFSLSQFIWDFSQKVLKKWYRHKIVQDQPRIINIFLKTLSNVVT